MRGLDESVLDATALDDPTAFNVDLSGLADFEEGSSVDIADDEPTVLAKTGDFSKLEAAMDSDTVEQPRLETSAHGDTAEQPEIAVDDLPDLDDSASIVPATDEATMTEVGTKLDLARAYVDMGDPDGARSILSEVLDEGSEPQQQEARQILEELAD
jgi:pilus assembly protein FimV